MPSLEQDIVRVARSYVGTKWHHQGRSPGIAIDCVGILVCTAQELKLPHEDYANYGPDVDGKVLEAMLEKYLVPVTELKPGYVMSFDLNGWGKPEHVSICTEPDRMVHARTRYTGGIVREETITRYWREHVRRIYRYRYDQLNHAPQFAKDTLSA